MPADPLSALLAGLSFAWRQTPAAPRELTNIQWRASDCDAGSVLFFQRFDDGQSDADLYARYLHERPFAALVTNRRLDCFDQLGGRALYVTRPGEFAEVARRCCDLLWPLDTERLRFIGVTGTNGKTTTVKYLESMLVARGQRVLSIGTLGVFRNGLPLQETGFTSPPLIELRRLLYAEQAQCDLVLMEASSHALDQGRLHGIPLAYAGWTNFTQDHLDYHQNEAAYFAAKVRILNLLVPGGRLYCSSPAVAERLQSQPETAAAQTVPVCVLAPAQLRGAAISAKPFLALDHNRANYALAVALADALVGPATPGADDEPWRHLQPVDGRFECQVFGQRTLVIDFAHTPDALATILDAIRGGFPGARVAAVFGCGGDRDRGKRPLMGAAVAARADHVIVTSDNPRTEAPAAIIEDILAGMPAGGKEVVVERPAAVARLFDFLAARPADEPWVALIAGKGHERTIDANGHKTWYSDQEEVARNVGRLGWGLADGVAPENRKSTDSR